MSSQKNTGPLRIGDVFLGKYHILEMMGRGGFGCVYRARSEFIGREVAIKVIDRHGSGQALSRGQQEAVILGKLHHPNIVEVYDADISPDGQLYIIMELLRGATLADWLRNEGPFEVSKGLRILEGLCAAFADAHREGVFHRDIKPANIFLSEDGSPKVLDFGIAKMVGSTGVRTAPNMVVGTSLYVSPEQLHAQSAGGHKPAPELSDIYALGLVAFQMFHGQHPLILKEPDADFRNPQVVWRLHVQTTAPLLDEVIPGFPTAVAQLVHTAVAKDPANRLPSMAEFGKKAKIARLHYSADESEAQFSPIQARKPSQRPSAPAAPHEAAATSTRPLGKRGTVRLFTQLPKGAPHERSSSEKLPPSDRPAARWTPPTRFDKVPNSQRPASAPPAETPEPASHTVTFKAPAEAEPTDIRRTTALMAAAGLILGIGGMLWLDPLGTQRSLGNDDIVIEGTSPVELAAGPQEADAPKEEAVELEAAEEKDTPPDPPSEPASAEPPSAPIVDLKPTPAVSPKPTPRPTVKKSSPTAKPAPSRTKTKEPIEADPELPASGLWDNEPWLE